MTHHPIQTLEDGTRVYSNGYRYTPKKPEERLRKVRKPDVPGAVLWRGNWLLPLDVLPEESRVMPETRPDDDAYAHMDRSSHCGCRVCRRPQAAYHQRRWRRAHGLPC